VRQSFQRGRNLDNFPKKWESGYLGNWSEDLLLPVGQRALIVNRDQVIEQVE
jgi:hypothetical protein